MRRGQGDEVVGSRPYRPGDHVAWIDWPASARLSAARGTDEFVVREYLAQEAPRAVVLADRRPSMSLYGPDLPWLDKPAAVAEAATSIAASAVVALGEVAYVDNARPDGSAHWLPPAGRGAVTAIGERLATAPFTAPARSLALGLETILRHGPLLPPGSFVFVLSDFLEPVRSSVWLRLRALRWDVVPVLVQDPAWEQGFPEVGGLVVPFADPATGRLAPTRFTSREARELAAAHEARLALALRTFRRLGFDPVVLSRSEPGAASGALAAWSARRQALLRGAA
jgi:uncharacterized protein (DUF58 family)